MVYTMPTLPTDGTIIMIVTTGSKEADASTDQCILGTTDGSLIYHDVSGNGIAGHDSTTEITEALAFAINTKYLFALQWETGGNFNVGVAAYGSFVDASWGTAQAFDGSFPSGANLILGKTLLAPWSIERIIIRDDTPTASFINANY